MLGRLDYQRKQNQGAQKKSIEKDIGGLEREIAELKAQNLDTKEKAREREKGWAKSWICFECYSAFSRIVFSFQPVAVKAKRQAIAQKRFEDGLTGNSNNSRTVAPTSNDARPSNPYAKRNKSQQSSADGSQAIRLGSKSQRGLFHSNSLSQPASTSRTPSASRPNSYSYQQHPHRSGRIRVDKQFASTVSILAPPPPPSVSQANSSTSILDSSDDSSDEELFRTPFNR